MKDIVIIADFCGSFDEKTNSRFRTIAKLLSDNNDVELVTSDYYHERKTGLSIDNKLFPYKVTLLHEKAYKKNISVKRFISHYYWGKEVYKYLKARRRPDIIYCAVPPLFAPLRASSYCRKNKIPFFIDIQDLWPEAFRLVFNIPVISNIVLYPYKKIADTVYRRADSIIAVSNTYAERALRVNRKCRDPIVAFLGTDIKAFDRSVELDPVIKKNEEEIWVGYCGTLGRSYDLSCVIDAISLLSDERIRLIVMGDGPELRTFEARAAAQGIKATFTGRLPYKDMCCLLKQCDIAVNPISHNAAQSIINKHADYVAAGIPIISTQENDEIRKLIIEYDMGFNCNNGDARDVAEKLKKLISDGALRKKMGTNARACAEELFDRGDSYNRIIRTLQDL